MSGPPCAGARSRRATASPGRDERWGVWGAISGPPISLVPFHDLVQRRPQIRSAALEMGMDSQGAAEEVGGLAVLLERDVAEALARQRAEMIRVARERPAAVGDRAGVVLRHA